MNSVEMINGSSAFIRKLIQRESFELFSSHELHCDADLCFVDRIKFSRIEYYL